MMDNKLADVTGQSGRQPEITWTKWWTNINMNPATRSIQLQPEMQTDRQTDRQHRQIRPLPWDLPSLFILEMTVVVRQYLKIDPRHPKEDSGYEPAPRELKYCTK
uniref:Uncharacterized protein n=1 Tax=Timema cristinae TaxID=61476 RepID=A0A7R9GZ31_TIMCR|nr:unnamed protein product [Timema cristinae]